MQEPANGTGHAIQCCVPDIKKMIYLNINFKWNNPLIKSETMIKMFNNNKKNNCCIMTRYLTNYGIGRII